MSEPTPLLVGLDVQKESDRGQARRGRDLHGQKYLGGCIVTGEAKKARDHHLRQADGDERMMRRNQRNQPTPITLVTTIRPIIVKANTVRLPTGTIGNTDKPR